MGISNMVIVRALTVIVIGVVGAPLQASQSLFVSTDSYVSYGSFSIDTSKPFSVQIWAKDTNPSDDYYSWFWGFDYSVTMGAVNNSEVAASMSNSTTGSPYVSYSQNAWVHTVLVYDGGSIWTVYVNGTAHSFNPIAPFTEVISRLTIGSRGQSTNEDFEGELDDLAIWDKALTLAEVTALYNGGTGLPAHVDGGNYVSSGNLTTYFTFESEYVPVIGKFWPTSLVGTTSFTDNALNTPSLKAAVATPKSVPVMSPWGLLGLSSLVGLIGFINQRRRPRRKLPRMADSREREFSGKLGQGDSDEEIMIH